MRGRRFGADVVDGAVALLVSVPLALFLFSGGGRLVWPTLAPQAFDDWVDRSFEPLLSVRLLVASVAVAWAMVLMALRLGAQPTLGELAMGLSPPDTGNARWKSWVRSLFFFDGPLGWLLPFRPVDRVLGIDRVRDSTTSVLEALGNAWRKKPSAPPLLGVFAAVAVLLVPSWTGSLELHHRMILRSMIAEYDNSFCISDLQHPSARANLRAIGWAERLAPDTWRDYLPPGSLERETAQQAVGLLEGRCGALRPGDAIPAGASALPRPLGDSRTLLAGGAERRSDPCYYTWANGSGQARPSDCGEFLLLGDDWSVHTAGGNTARCAVYARGDRIAAVVGLCSYARR